MKKTTKKKTATKKVGVKEDAAVLAFFGITARFWKELLAAHDLNVAFILFTNAMFIISKDIHDEYMARSKEAAAKKEGN